MTVYFSLIGGAIEPRRITRINEVPQFIWSDVLFDVFNILQCVIIKHGCATDDSPYLYLWSKIVVFRFI
jgi:hypothetical protein